jgi:hypothetical protein
MLIPQNPKKKTGKAPITPEPEPSSLTLDSSALRVDFSQTVEQTVVITIDSKTILTLGSLMVITGKPKARKSTFLHTFLGLAVRTESIWGISVNLPAARKKVILIDTEQSLYDLHQSIKRLAHNFRLDLTSTAFQVYTARALDVGQIMSLIDTLLSANPDCSLIAIDGLIDLVNDINDVVEAKSAVHYLKGIADRYSVAIVGILHQNKSTNFSLGHLGSFLSRFAQSELAVVKNDDNTSTLSSTFLRSADDISPITIGYDTLNERYDTLETIALGQLRHSDISTLSAIFDKDNYLTYTELVKRGKAIVPESQYYLEKKLIPFWYDSGFLSKRSGYVHFTPN